MATAITHHERIALVTGGGRGIGRAIALALAREGMDIALLSRTNDEIQNVAKEIAAIGRRGAPIPCDVTDQVQVNAAVERAKKLVGPVTILVNNAGAASSSKFLNHDDALWHRMIATNLDSTYYVTKAVLPMMLETGWGRIINVASIAAKAGGKYIAAYTASKHGVLGLTRALAAELAASSITVNAVCPGYVDTPMTEQSITSISERTKMDSRQARAYLENTNPQGRLITAEEVAALVVMLASDNARGINGQAINVDGGAVMF